jgi:hypothetical protein
MICTHEGSVILNYNITNGWDISLRASCWFRLSDMNSSTLKQRPGRSIGTVLSLGHAQVTQSHYFRIDMVILLRSTFAGERLKSYWKSRIWFSPRLFLHTKPVQHPPNSPVYAQTPVAGQAL